MLATSYFAPSSSPHPFLPAIPSPLSPRSANIHGRHPPRDSMSEPPKQKPARIFETTHIDVSSSSSKATPFSQRPVKKAPSPTQTELKDRRRTNFLRKIRDQRDDKRFEARGEDVMRLDFMQRKRAYERELARSAPSLQLDPMDEEEYELPGWSQQGSQMQLSSQQEEADEFEREEESELMALLEYMPTEEGGEESSMWSDDADYDALFSEVMEQENGEPQCGSQAQQQDGEEMDMS